MKHLETIGAVDLFLDEESRDIVVAIKTDIGTVSVSVVPEKACQLGVALIRESGKRYVFKQREQPPVVAPPQPEEDDHDTQSGNSNGVGGRTKPDHEPISLDGSTGWGSVPRRDIPGSYGDDGPSKAESP